MKKIIISAASLLTIVLTGAPYCVWDFEKYDAQKKECIPLPDGVNGLFLILSLVIFFIF